MGSGKLSLVRSSSRGICLYILTFNTMWKAGTDEDRIFRVAEFSKLSFIMLSLQVLSSS